MCDRSDGSLGHMQLPHRTDCIYGLVVSAGLLVLLNVCEGDSCVPCMCRGNMPHSTCAGL